VDYPEMTIAGLNPLQVYQQEKPFILDIRGHEVSRMGNIPGALKIPLDDLPDRLAELPRDKAIIIIDHAGQQAPICARFLHSNGYTTLFILEGGMINWIRQGFPTR
jgi:rhodanese-related sulfurtransferase